jgi:hypothetical protein
MKDVLLGLLTTFSAPLASPKIIERPAGPVDHFTHVAFPLWLGILSLLALNLAYSSKLFCN